MEWPWTCTCMHYTLKCSIQEFGPQNIVLNFRVFLYPNHVEQMLQTVCSLNIFAKFN